MNKGLELQKIRKTVRRTVGSLQRALEVLSSTFIMFWFVMIALMFRLDLLRAFSVIFPFIERDHGCFHFTVLFVAILKLTCADFKKASNEEKLALFSSLLKGYQEEVDKLTKRAKFGENAFLNIYQKLYEAPDPYPVLSSIAVST